MQTKHIIVAGLAMLLLHLPLFGKITTSISGQTISVQSDKIGIAGLKGCDPATAQSTPAYIFQLQKKQNNTPNTCSGSTGKWTMHAQKESTDGSTIFTNLADGKYRIICLSGEAIGCQLTGTSDRSIVFAKETSEVINLGQKTLPESINKLSASTSTELKVFPNPAKDKINIQLSSSSLHGDINITLYDILGKQLKTVSKNYQQASIQIWEMEINSYSSGTYLIRLSDTQGNALHQKVIIENHD